MSVYKPAGSKTHRYTYSEYQADGTRKRRIRVAPSKTIARAREAQMRAVQQEVRQKLRTPREAKALEHAGRTLLDHLPDYVKDMVAAKRSPAHVRTTECQLLKLLRLAPFRTAEEATPEGLRRAMDAYMGEEGKSNGRRAGQHTANKAAKSLKTMLNWMADNGRLKANPIARAKLPRVTENRRPRRAVDAATIEKLATAARYTSRGRDPLTAEDREMLVRLAFATGLRSGELRSLTPTHLKLTVDEPHVFIESEYSKNRKNASIPISAATAGILRPWAFGIPPHDRLFPVGKKWSFAEMMRSICKRAGVPYHTAEGFLDGHSLRHSAITNWAQRTDVKTVQELARHATPTMTMKYMHTDESKKRRAVEGK